MGISTMESFQPDLEDLSSLQSNRGLEMITIIWEVLAAISESDHQGVFF
jgi:hypothetical protein